MAWIRCKLCSALGGSGGGGIRGLCRCVCLCGRLGVGLGGREFVLRARRGRRREDEYGPGWASGISWTMWASVAPWGSLCRQSPWIVVAGGAGILVAQGRGGSPAWGCLSCFVTRHGGEETPLRAEASSDLWRPWRLWGYAGFSDWSGSAIAPDRGPAGCPWSKIGG